MSLAHHLMYTFLYAALLGLMLCTVHTDNEIKHNSYSKQPPASEMTFVHMFPASLQVPLS